MPAKFILYNNGSIETTQEQALEVLRQPNSKPMAFFWDDEGNFYKASKGKVLITTSPIEPNAVLGNQTKPVKVGVEMLLPKIPLHLFTQILSFFKDICDETGKEVFARIYYDIEEAQYITCVPKQTISKCNVRYDIDDERFQDENRYLFVMDIHSHNTMGAFFSGTDDRDETTNGRLYAVVGELDNPIPKCKVRTYLDPNHIETDFFSVFEKPVDAKIASVTPYGTFEYEVPDEVLLPAILSTTTDFPAEWKDQIVKEEFIRTNSQQMTFDDSVFMGFNHSYRDIQSPSTIKNNFSKSTSFKPKGQLHISGWQDDADDMEVYDFDEENVNLSELSEEEMYELALKIASDIADIYTDTVSTTSNDMFNKILSEVLQEHFGIDLDTSGGV